MVTPEPESAFRSIPKPIAAPLETLSAGQARPNRSECTCRWGTFSLRRALSTAEVIAGGPQTYTSRSVMSGTRCAQALAARTAGCPPPCGR